jgi:putative ABC transport system permease protein
MFLNYLKLSLRLLARNPFFTFINVTGLSVGFAVFFVLWQYSQNELNSDKQWKDWERIGLLGFYWEWTDDGKSWENNVYRNNDTGTPAKLASDYSEIESFTRIIYQRNFSPEYTDVTNKVVISIENNNGTKKYFKEDNMVCADANLFGFFSIPLLIGNPSTVLYKSNSVVLNQSTTTKHFGKDDPIGRSILINNAPYEVTGVFKDLPHNTHLSFSMVISNQSKLNYWNITHPNPTCYAYLKSKQLGNWKEFEDKINQPEMIQKYWGEVMKHFPNGKAENRIFPLSEVSFSQWSWNQAGSKSKPLLIAFQLIGTIVLILAIVNYIMLNTSRTASRQKEVATRKVSGASTKDFLKQFFIETSIIFLIAILLALTIIQLSKAPLQLWLLIPVVEIKGNSIFIFSCSALVGIAICTAYPVFMSQAFQPRALLTNLNVKLSGRRFTLAMIQYTSAIALLVWAFAVRGQISFLLNQHLGFNKENLIAIDGPIARYDNLENKIKTFTEKTAALKGVGMLSASAVSMGDRPKLLTVRRPGVEYPVVFDAHGGVDEHFIPLHNLTIVDGRNFLPDEAANVIILSEGALVRLGFPNSGSAVGSNIDVLSTDEISKGGEWLKTEVIGVMKGYRVRPLFQYGSEYDKEDRGIGLTYRSKPVVSFLPEKITLQVESQNFGETIDLVQKTYESTFPGNVFSWSFLDENVNRHYQSEKIWRNQILLFTCLAIGIACIGLLGMTSNKVVEKTKEIGIRKVLGAQLHQIAQILLNTTARQIIVATIIGIPMAWYLTQQYLQKFSERIELHWWHFALPVLTLIMIMLGTVAAVLWKAAKSNPVEALKHE